MIFIVVDFTEGIPDGLIGPALYRTSQINTDDLSQYAGVDVIFETSYVFHFEFLHLYLRVLLIFSLSSCPHGCT